MNKFIQQAVSISNPQPSTGSATFATSDADFHWPAVARSQALAEYLQTEASMLVIDDDMRLIESLLRAYMKHLHIGDLTIKVVG